MESNTSEQAEFEFLKNTQVQQHFSELNIELLRGVHILSSDVTLFGILDLHRNPFEHYYRKLYNLELQQRTYDGISFFYLEFPVTGKGKLSNSSLFQELDAESTIVGFVLANLYYASYFSFDKKFHWDDIQYEIEHGEHKEAYQNLFFNGSRAEYSDKEWDNVKRQFRVVINFFDRIRLIEKEESEENIHFTILPSILHFIEIYQKELENTDEFLKEIKLTA
jgi:hypothetical protein